jgi:hypothetical protein
MKAKFELFIKKACEYYGIKPVDLFKKGGPLIRADARYLLYFLCIRAGMRNTIVYSMVLDKKFFLNKSDITRGVAKWQDRVEFDEDLYLDIKKMEVKK